MAKQKVWQVWQPGRTDLAKWGCRHLCDCSSLKCGVCEEAPAQLCVTLSEQPTGGACKTCDIVDMPLQQDPNNECAWGASAINPGSCLPVGVTMNVFIDDGKIRAQANGDTTFGLCDGVVMWVEQDLDNCTDDVTLAYDPDNSSGTIADPGTGFGDKDLTVKFSCPKLCNDTCDREAGVPPQLYVYMSDQPTGLFCKLRDIRYMPLGPSPVTECVYDQQASGDQWLATGVNFFAEFRFGKLEAWVEGSGSNSCDGRVDYTAADVEDCNNFDLALPYYFGSGDISDPAQFGGKTVRISTFVP